MKQIGFMLGVFVLIAACSSQKPVVNDHQRVLVEKVAEDSVEYDVETFDSGFETWYKLHDNKAMYRSQQYYELWNQQYVNEWNNNAKDPRKSRFFEPIVGYNPATDYGFELNHKLFYYFQYVENVLKIKILANSPKAVPF